MIPVPCPLGPHPMVMLRDDAEIGRGRPIRADDFAHLDGSDVVRYSIIKCDTCKAAVSHADLERVVLSVVPARWQP